MTKFLNKQTKEHQNLYYRLIGILLVIIILAGGGAIIYKSNKNSKSLPADATHQALQAGETNSNTQIQNNQNTNLQPLSSKININIADEKELDALPGIGPVKAKAILDYRKKNGQFKVKRDIIKVKGIGEKTFEKLEDKITVN